jgi:hypothetical protein
MDSVGLREPTKQIRDFCNLNVTHDSKFDPSSRLELFVDFQIFLMKTLFPLGNFSQFQSNLVCEFCQRVNIGSHFFLF